MDQEQQPSASVTPSVVTKTIHTSIGNVIIKPSMPVEKNQDVLPVAAGPLLDKLPSWKILMPLGFIILLPIIWPTSQIGLQGLWLWIMRVGAVILALGLVDLGRKVFAKKPKKIFIISVLVLFILIVLVPFVLVELGIIK